MRKKFRDRKDRKDGKYIKHVDGFHYIMPYLMPKRTEAEVYINAQLDVTELMKYVEERNQDPSKEKITLFHAFATAVAKTIYYRPLLNNFVAGRRMYRRNKMTLAFVVRRYFADEAEESLLVTEVNGDTTLDKMAETITRDSSEIRRSDGNSINKLLDNLKRVPRWLMRTAMCVFRFLDFHGFMPESICKDDSNYATVLLSNLGSIQCGAAYHHLNNYGTNSLVITIGKVHKASIVDEQGKTEICDVVDLGMTADERIADGFYFARSIKLMEKILQEPKKLEMAIRDDII